MASSGTEVHRRMCDSMLSGLFRGPNFTLQAGRLIYQIFIVHDEKQQVLRQSSYVTFGFPLFTL
jgi:hypothetical protein